MRLTRLEGDPRPIAVARMGLGLATLLNTAEMFVLLSQIAGGKLAFPVHSWIPEPSIFLLYCYAVPASLAGIAIMVGWHTAGAAVVSTVLSVCLFMWDQQTYSSHRFLATLLVAYLVFARSDAVWSLSGRHRPVPWWPQLLMMTQLSVCYFFAAVSKLNAVFISGVPLSQWVWVPLPWWVFTFMAISTVVVELFLAFGLWLRNTRRIAMALGVLLHGSIVLMMRDQTLVLIAFSLTCLSLYGLFALRPPISIRERVLDPS